jgi:hypothetical protein
MQAAGANEQARRPLWPPLALIRQTVQSDEFEAPISFDYQNRSGDYYDDLVLRREHRPTARPE